MLVCTQTHQLPIFKLSPVKSEVEIASAALNLTADVPCHDDTDSDYDSECDDLDDIFF